MRAVKPVLCAAVICFLTCAVVAQEAVKFSYYAIKASKSETGETEIPDSLKSLADILKQTGYTKFESLGANTLSPAAGKAVSVALTKVYSMTLTAQKNGDNCTLKVQIIDKSGGKENVIVDTTVPLKKGKPIVITGPAVDGGELVLVFVGQ